MRTQSRDTSLEVEQIQIAGLRTFAPAKKFASVRSISASMHFAAMYLLAESKGPYGGAVAFLERSSSPQVVNAFRASVPHPSEWVLAPFDLLPPLEQVSCALDQAHIKYALAGTLARALYGFPRSVRVLELVVYLEWPKVMPFVQGLRREQFVLVSDGSQGEEPPQRIDLLSLPGLVGVELCLPGDSAEDAAHFSQTHLLVLDQHVPPVAVLAPEACVLQGMLHYQAAGERDDDLYNEILGVLKIQGPVLDLDSLTASATTLGGKEVLKQLLEDAGITAGSQTVVLGVPPGGARALPEPR